VLDHLRREIDAQHIRAAMSQLDCQRPGAATGIEDAPAAKVFGKSVEDSLTHGVASRTHRGAYA
jgi:hypothetical protein